MLFMMYCRIKSDKKSILSIHNEQRYDWCGAVENRICTDLSATSNPNKAIRCVKTLAVEAF